MSKQAPKPRFDIKNRGLGQSHLPNGAERALAKPSPACPRHNGAQDAVASPTERNFDIRFAKSRVLIAMGEWPSALEELLG
jgi:hypothetical protein